MIAATNRLKDYPVRIVYEREPLRRSLDWVNVACWLFLGVFVLLVLLGMYQAAEIGFWAFETKGSDMRLAEMSDERIKRELESIAEFKASRCDTWSDAQREVNLRRELARRRVARKHDEKPVVVRIAE